MKFILFFCFFLSTFYTHTFLPEQVVEIEQHEDISKLPTKQDEFHESNTHTNINNVDENKMIVQFELDKIYFLQYERIVALFGQMNEIYNKSNSLIPQDEFSEDIFEQFKQKADIFDETKVFYDLIFGEGQEIQEELNDFLQNIDKIILQPMTCIELFGFKNFYHDLTQKLDKNRKDVIELQESINFSVKKFNFFLKDAVKAFNNFLDIPGFLKSVLYPFMPMFIEAQPDPGDAAVSLREFENMYSILMKQIFDEFHFFQKGLQYLKQYRMKLYYKILEFKALPEDINEFDLNESKKIVQLNVQKFIEKKINKKLYCKFNQNILNQIKFFQKKQYFQ